MYPPVMTMVDEQDAHHHEYDDTCDHHVYRAALVLWNMQHEHRRRDDDGLQLHPCKINTRKETTSSFMNCEIIVDPYRIQDASMDEQPEAGGDGAWRIFLEMAQDCSLRHDSDSPMEEHDNHEERSTSMHNDSTSSSDDCTSNPIGNKGYHYEDDSDESYHDADGKGPRKQQSRRRGACKRDKYNTGPWTAEEHDLFMRAYEKYGSDWSFIAKHMVRTRSRTQIASHAQTCRNKHLL